MDIEQELQDLGQEISKRCINIVKLKLNQLHRDSSPDKYLMIIRDNMEQIYLNNKDYLEDCIKKGLIIEAANTEGKIAAITELDSYLSQDIKEYKSIFDNND